jgi:hypothetical protein
MMPDFLIIGAAKGGTTSLYQYLDQHPEIYMSPIKEPRFFAYEGGAPDFKGPGDRSGREAVTRLEDYRALFAGRAREKAAGEASPLYLYDEEAPARIARYLPDAKLIAILRDPAERAFSEYSMYVREGRERLSFRKACEECAARGHAGWGPGWQYVERGLYARQLRRYYERFRPEQIRVLFYEDLCRDPRALVRQVLEFLGVDPGFEPDTERRHNAARAQPRALDRLVNRPNALKSVARAVLPGRLRGPLRDRLKAWACYKPRLGARDRAMLVGRYRDDIRELQRMTGRDLSAWMR